LNEIRWLSAGIGDVPAGLAWLDEAERARLSGMRFEKRRSEAVLGRWTAKNCVAQCLGLGVDDEALAQIAVRNASDGAPEVRIGGQRADLVIAMTDRADWAVAAVRSGPARIGCDLELVEVRSAGFVADYFTPAEQRSVAGGQQDLVANLIWSAKESALKVLRTGLRRDTRTVEVVLTGDDDGGWSTLAVRVDGASRLPGWWRRFGDFVLTVVGGVENDPPPFSLVSPCPLASARPSHAWMHHPLVETGPSRRG
jgi:4'-phosphopantetheinyl transferase